MAQSSRHWTGLLRARTHPTTTELSAYVDGVPVQDLEGVARVIGAGSLAISREQANSVAAVVAARNRILAAMSILSMQQVGADNKVVPRTWLTNLAGHQRSTVLELNSTVEDLLYDGRAYWQILSKTSGGGPGGVGFPQETRWIPQAYVTPVHRATHEYEINWPDRPMQRLRANEMIEFEGLHKGILHEGAATAIRDFLRLARAAAMFTNSPLPLGYFTAVDAAYEPDEDTIIRPFLRKWESSRRRGAYGWVPGGIKLETPAYDPAKLQLAEAKRETIVDIGRGTGAELEALGISTTSRTYFNATQVRQDYLDFTVGMYTVVIASRLSMDDVTPVGHAIQFDFDKFLRADPLTRMRTYQLGLLVGAYADEDEVREAEGKAPLTPEQKASRKAMLDAQAVKQAPSVDHQNDKQKEAP